MRRRDLVTFVARGRGVAGHSACAVWGVSIPLREHAPPYRLGLR